jgi:hypothetical protein
MEAGGSYNLHARIPAGGGKLALPHLEHAVRNIALNGDNRPVVIADYGSSQGKNSLAPMRAAIAALRARLGPDRPIVVVHVDQAANDFNTLFDVLHNDPDRYTADDPNVFPSAIGRSFYGTVLPPDHVHLGWSSYAVVWLSRVPMPVPGQIMAFRAAGEARAAFERQGAEDWRSFLSLRARELRSGGRLVVVLPGVNDHGSTGFEDLFDQANLALADMVEEGSITADERARMVLAGFPRRRSDLLAPFAKDGKFCGLMVERCETSMLPDAAWADYEQDGNKDLLATRHAQFFRSVFAPSLSCALSKAADAAACRAFADRLEDGLKQRFVGRPVPLHSFVHTIVLAKQDPHGTVRGNEGALIEWIGTVARP